MLLTRRERLLEDPRPPFPTVQLALLALVRVAEPIALTSVLPYAWKLVQHFHISEQHASLYAGFFICAFALAESLTGMVWGGLSDRVGRKPVLLFGCVGTVLSLLVVGFSTNYWMAVFGRALGGLLNGNIGVIQTMVGELVTRPEYEPRAYAVMPFVWSIGTIVGPAIGGYFAEPCENFPSVFPRHGIFARFPYLLPNLICAALLVAAILAGLFMIKETHPDMQPWSAPINPGRSTAGTPLIATAGAIDHVPSDLRDQSYGTFNAIETQDRQSTPSSGEQSKHGFTETCPKAFNRRVVLTTIALGIFTYHAMTYDNLLPIFLQDDWVKNDLFAGGLGLSLQQVGVIMSINGLIALFVQGVVFPVMASWMGVWKLFILVTVGFPIAYFIMPCLLFLPRGGALYAGLYVSLTIRNIFSILAYPLLLILLKEASPGPSYLGKINGLAASVGAACRTLASPISGSLYDLGTQIHFTPLAWWISGVIALAGAVQVFFIRPKKRKQTWVRPPIHYMRDETQYNDTYKPTGIVRVTGEDWEPYTDEEEQRYR